MERGRALKFALIFGALILLAACLAEYASSAPVQKRSKARVSQTSDDCFIPVTFRYYGIKENDTMVYRCNLYMNGNLHMTRKITVDQNSQVTSDDYYYYKHRWNRPPQTVGFSEHYAEPFDFVTVKGLAKNSWKFELRLSLDQAVAARNRTAVAKTWAAFPDQEKKKQLATLFDDDILDPYK